MTKEQFIIDMHARFVRFSDYWDAESKKDPEGFPKEMTVWDWEDQYLAWQQLYYEG